MTFLLKHQEFKSLLHGLGKAAVHGSAVGYLSRKDLTDTAFPGTEHLTVQLSQEPAQ